MVEISVVIVFFVIVITISEFVKNYHFSLILGMFFVIFSYVMVKTVPHMQHKHSEEFSFSHLMSVLAGEDANLCCVVCNSRDVTVTKEGDSRVKICCNSCKAEVTTSKDAKDTQEDDDAK